MRHLIRVFGAPRAAMKRVAVLTAVLAVMPAAAHASTTSWWDNQLPIPEGMEVSAPLTASKMTFSLKQTGVAQKVRVKCSGSGEVAVWNVLTEGRGEVRRASFACTNIEACAAPTVTAVDLPWSERLFGEEHPLSDELGGVGIDLRCGNTDYGAFTGTLNIGQGDADEQCEGIHDEVDTELRFLSTAGKLSGANGNLSIGGFAKQVGNGHAITGEVTPCKARGLGN